MNPLINLAERVEAAEGANRQIDGLIWQTSEPDGDYVAFGESEVLYRRDPSDSVAFDAPPPFTSSLDAAMQLVPEGWRWCRYAWPRTDEPCEATLIAFGGIAQGRAATPALALCAAALRAKAGEGL